MNYKQIIELCKNLDECAGNADILKWLKDHDFLSGTGEGFAHIYCCWHDKQRTDK